MNLLDLTAVLKLDSSDYESGINKASSVVKSLGVGLGIAIGAATTAVIGLTASVVNAYGEYEQLVGGVETLFGAGGKSVEEYADSLGLSVEEVQGQYDSLMTAQNTMLENAARAYETAGMSANDYMSTVTSFSASLIQGLGGDTEAAAAYADMAMQDMSDNANKMGTDMEMIENAYQGFARGNFTMLDNLKLGYGGTASEMVRLINDSGILEEEISSVDEVSFDQMVMAIHTVQDEMGITGTTANEASTTIQGSMNMTKAAWENLLIGMGDESQDISVLIDNLISSALTAFNNIAPVAQRAIVSIGTAITQIAPIIATELPALINDLLPDLITAVGSLLDGFITALPVLLNTIVEILPSLLDTVINAIIQVLPALVQVAVIALSTIGNALISSLPTLIPQIAQLISDIVGMLTAPNNLALLIEGAIQLIGALAVGIINALPILIDAVLQLIVNIALMIVDHGDEMLQSVEEVLGDVGFAIIQGFQNWLGITDEELIAILEAVDQWMVYSLAAVILFFSDVVNGVVSFFIGAKDKVVNGFNAVKEKITNFKNSAVGIFNSIKSSVSDIFMSIKTTITSIFTTIVSTVTNKLNSIKSTFTDIFNNVKSIVTNAINAVKGAFNFSWSLPHLNLPHISVSGGQAPYGIAGQGSLPSFSIQWYKKAYDDAYIMSGPTIFGAQGNKLLAGGEGNGSETIVGTSLLMDMMSDVVKSTIGSMDWKIYVDGKTLVGAIANDMDTELGRIAIVGAKGV